MPGFVTHYLFGVDAYKKIHVESIRRNLRKNHNAYALGMQGPDVFFYYLPTFIFHKTNIGDLAHRKDTGAFLMYLLESRTLFNGNLKYQRIADAYISGFLGHYTLDSIVHPYVYALTKYNPKEAPKDTVYFGQHAYLETEMDNEFLFLKKGLSPTQFRQHETIFLSASQKKVISKMLSYAYTNTYNGIKVYPFQISAATRWMCAGIKLMHDPSGQKKVIVRYIERLLFDRPYISAMMPSDKYKFVFNCFNLNHRSWKHPWTKETSNESFFDLYEKAEKKYHQRIMEYYGIVKNGYNEKELQNFVKRHGNYSFLSGLYLGSKASLKK